MTRQEIKKELNGIYKERRSWIGGKGPFDRENITRRTLIMIQQYILYKIEDAKCRKDKDSELFNLAIYKITKQHLNT